MKFFTWKKAVEQAGPDAAATGVNPMTGFTDSVMRGWFNAATGELFTGFPIGADDVVADIGCGDGGSAAFCARQGAAVILADIDPACIDAAAARLRAEPAAKPFQTHVTDSDPLPIATGACTRIICTEVLEHVPSPERLMAELARIGAPGARYLITCPDPGAEAIQQRVAHPSYFAAPNHVRIIRHEELDRYVREAGLILETRTSYGFYWSMWWTLFWATEASIEAPRHPVLDHWSRTWQALLDQPNGPAIKHALDDLLPKSQLILARKA
jgi:SAM-dependent methyltransferase